MSVFGNDPWWIVLIKVVFVVVFLLAITIFNVWYERRLVGKMQQRKGPIMNGPFGLGQALGDGLKLMFKEDFRPAGTDKWVFTIAPLLTGIAAFTGWAVIPLAGEVNMFGVTTRLQLTDMPVAVLFILAIASIGIYGIVLAGWASTSTYSLLGGIRSTAQMISYAIAMGLALVAVFLTSGSMSTIDIVNSQATEFGGAAWIEWLHIPQWYALLLIPSCIVYLISMVAETNRAPFDLVECEQELVSGFLTDYSGFRYAIYFLAEYINMATVSAVATTLFFGGYRAPWPVPLIIQLNPAALSWLDSGWMGLFWFTSKLLIFIGLFVWLRGTLPRFRYDQFMDLGWKVLIPVSIAWIVLVSGVRVLQANNILNSQWAIGGVVVVLILLLTFIAWDWWRGGDEEELSETSRMPLYDSGEFDPFEGGYPVPPMPGQVLPELVGVLRSSSSETADTESQTEPEREDA
jgi:NADH-quinone oxidoreductase subunit H